MPIVTCMTTTEVHYIILPHTINMDMKHIHRACWSSHSVKKWLATGLLVLLLTKNLSYTRHELCEGGYSVRSMASSMGENPYSDDQKISRVH